MATRRKTDEDDMTEDATEDPASSAAPEASRTEIKEVVLGLLRELGLVGAGDQEEPGGEGDTAEVTGDPLTPRQQEDHMERLTRYEVEKILEAKDLKDTVRRLEQVVERPPAEVRRLTKALWGSGKE
jgi:hypothetical protein